MIGDGVVKAEFLIFLDLCKPSFSGYSSSILSQELLNPGLWGRQKVPHMVEIYKRG
jgi:hypothetical protein